MDNDNDESAGNGLREYAEFSVNVYDLTQGTKDFKAWFEKSFTTLCPDLASSIEVGFKTDQETEESKLEIANYVPTIFPTSALLVLWETSTSGKKAGKQNTINPGLN